MFRCEDSEVQMRSIKSAAWIQSTFMKIESYTTRKSHTTKTKLEIGASTPATDLSANYGWSWCIRSYASKSTTYIKSHKKDQEAKNPFQSIVYLFPLILANFEPKRTSGWWHTDLIQNRQPVILEEPVGEGNSIQKHPWPGGGAPGSGFALGFFVVGHFAVGQFTVRKKNLTNLIWPIRN